MKTALLLVAALLFAANVAYSFSPHDSCLVLLRYAGNNEPPGWNEDSVRRDECHGSPTFYHEFGKKWFWIEFPSNFYPFDHVLDTNEIKSVNDIDSSHLGMKNRFLELQDTLGAIYFCGNRIKSSDSMTYLQPTIRMSFGNYQDIEYICEHFATTIDSVVHISFISYASQPTNAVDEVGTNSTVLYPNPVKNVLLIKNQFTAKDNDRIELFSVDGKRIFETAYQEKLDVSMLHSGSYFLRINNQTIKFIKK